VSDGFSDGGIVGAGDGLAVDGALVGL
jgi:hypothetical protein